MTYLKGKDGKIKNIEELDNVNNRGIEIRYHTTDIEVITVKDGKVRSWKKRIKTPEGFEGW